MSASPGVLILGGGPAGLGAALGLARRGMAPTVLEAGERVGGNAGSFLLHGVPVDYGSHRLHPATDPEILAELRALLGEELLTRPRHGRILLGGRWVHFPLRALDLALGAPPAFVFGAARDAARRALGGSSRGGGGAGPAGGAETFATVLLDGLGPTVCRDFYFPYARKVWGLDPHEIAAAQARRRVSAASTGALLRRLLPGAGGGARSPRGTFFYPRGGFGRIAEALAAAAESAGARILTGTRVVRVGVGAGPAAGLVEVEDALGRRPLSADHVWSTLPLAALVSMAEPSAPGEVAASAAALEQRAMVLVYLVLGQDRFSAYDAHYFPSPDVPFTRVSEPKNYGARDDLPGRTVLCAEIPCSRSDGVWSADAAALGALVADGLARAGLPVLAPVLDVAVRRLPSAYPVYRAGYEEHFARVDAWVSALPGVLTFGRQGLHAHDNTHHALAMARAAVACLGDDGRFDRSRWEGYRRVFEGHVVED